MDDLGPCPFLRVPMAGGGERVLLSRLADGRVMCCLCMDYFERDALWVDEHGDRWDMCRECGEAEALLLGRKNTPDRNV